MLRHQREDRRRKLTSMMQNVDARLTRDAACHVVDSVQHLPRGEQLVGMACTFLLVCEYVGLPARDVLEIAENVLKRARFRDETHFDGLRNYFRHWLKDIL